MAAGSVESRRSIGASPSAYAKDCFHRLSIFLVMPANSRRLEETGRAIRKLRSAATGREPAAAAFKSCRSVAALLAAQSDDHFPRLSPVIAMTTNAR